MTTTPVTDIELQQNLFEDKTQTCKRSQDQALTEQTHGLTQLEVFNWGPFSGLHRIHFDANGCSLIGQTGSGKTTLVDAIMTLICAQPKYNLASTGGHESDRDLMSYIRGVTGIGGEDETAHIARPGQTMTAISAEFSSNQSQVRLSSLLWLDSTSTSQSDMKRLWIFDPGNHQGLSDYLQQLQELGSRGLKIELKERQGVIVTDKKKAYLAHCRRFFEVGENAFVLLNRAAGLKQLNSIDALFRELVLDDHSAFERAAEVANEFDELQGIHAELQIAKKQHTTLLPIAQTYKKFQQSQNKLQQFIQLQKFLPLWFAHHGFELWSQQAEKLQLHISQYETQLEQTLVQLYQQQALVDEAYEKYQQLGGASIEDLKRQIVEKHQDIARLQQNIRDYQQICKATQLDTELSPEKLQHNKQLAEKLFAELTKQLIKLEQALEQQIQKTRNAEEQQSEQSNEIKEVQAAPDSNIPGKFRSFQYELAQQLNIDADDIPYIAQCVEVQDKAWHGAIERAIGSHRLRLLIDAEYMPAALNWINQRDNQLHVRLLNNADYQQTASRLDDGFCHKLKFKDSIHHQSVKNFLSSIDRHCVASAHELRQTPYGMTREGLMSGKRGLFEKQDQKPITSGWLTGFDNQARLAELQQNHQQISSEARQLRQQLVHLKEQQQKLQTQQTLLKNVQEISFTELDDSTSKNILLHLQQRLENLQNPASDTAKSEQLWLAAKQQLDNIQQTLNGLNVNKEVALKELNSANKQAELTQKRLTIALTQEQLEWLGANYNTPNAEQLEVLADLEREQTQALNLKSSAQQKQLSDLQARLGKLMVSALKEDTGALSEAGTELEDIPHYIERLNVLSKEDLPAKLERFLHYLNQSSDQGVTQLLTRIENEVSIIEERIEELNATMKQVDFQPGRYLQLIPQKVSHESLQSLQRSQRDLRSAALMDDHGESHYKSLMILIQQLRDAVERKKTRPALSLLDPRYRLQFSVSIIERGSELVLETRTGSQGGSGGEKEIIASYILTASLSYALCPKHRHKPMFATVILDEAFSKSSQAVAARIIAALSQFGLHPLFVTPNKEMRLLRTHTASAVLVHRRKQQSYALSLSWEEIDQHILQRQQQ